MNKFCAVFIVVLFSHAALGFRHKRQLDDSDVNLDDRYGLNNRPWMQPNYPWTGPNRPWLGPNGPWMGPNGPWIGPNNPWDVTPFPIDPTTVPTTTSTQAPSGSSTQSPTVQACIRSCPVTSEYNPVCGSNGDTYDNPGRLTCAQMCGVSVTLLRQSRCPPATPAPTA